MDLKLERKSLILVLLDGCITDNSGSRNPRDKLVAEWPQGHRMCKQLARG